MKIRPYPIYPVGGFFSVQHIRLYHGDYAALPIVLGLPGEAWWK